MANAKNKKTITVRANRRQKRRRAYLTKRILVRAARAGAIDATASTLQAMSYNVIAQRGRVVRVYADGRTIDIGPIEHQLPANTPLVLD